jgi:hypothetical protein
MAGGGGGVEDHFADGGGAGKKVLAREVGQYYFSRVMNGVPPPRARDSRRRDAFALAGCAGFTGRAGPGCRGAGVTTGCASLEIPVAAPTERCARLVRRFVATTERCARLVRRFVATTERCARLVRRFAATTERSTRAVRRFVATTKWRLVPVWPVSARLLAVSAFLEPKVVPGRRRAAQCGLLGRNHRKEGSRKPPFEQRWASFLQSKCGSPLPLLVQGKDTRRAKRQGTGAVQRQARRCPARFPKIQPTPIL